MYQSIIYQKEGAVAVIQINRPQKMNSLNIELRHEMEEVMREIAADAKQRAVSEAMRKSQARANSQPPPSA